MSHDAIKLSDYAIGEEQLENLATEFYGHVLYPAGNHAVAHISFAPHPDFSREDLRRQFTAALTCYQRKKC